jgi:alpha-L-fucosidase
MQTDTLFPSSGDLMSFSFFRGRLSLIFAVLFSVSFANAQWAPMVTDAGAAQRIEWWREARFGMFLHWGVYSIPGRGEWVQWAEQIPTDQYAKLADQFHPEHFDADAWAAIAKAGGMKYMVLTARHHDGFALFDDPGSSFTAMKSAAHHDFVADYVKAVRKAGLGVGLYYSPLDWRFPGFFFPGIYQPSAIELRAQYDRQIAELGSHYGKLDLLWFDGGGDEWLGFGGAEFTGGGWRARPKDKRYSGTFDWQDVKTVGNLRQLQPGIILNDRTDAPADFRSREGDGALGDFDNQHPWELCTTITKGAWGYQPNAQVKPLAQLVQLLVGAAGRDGNMLLNVGPRPDGQIDPAQADRVREIGEWLGVYGESIYGTRGGPWLPGPYGVSTHNGKAVYVHVLHRPEGSDLVLPTLPTRIVKAAVLGGDEVEFEQTSKTVTLHLPNAAEGTIDTVVKMELAEPWTTSSVVPVSGK